jgi:SH3-like domain-containing protein
MAFVLQIGQTYTVQGDIGARYEPAEISGVAPVFEVKKGDAFRIAASQDEFVQVESHSLKGWIPAWYFSEEAAAIRSETPYDMIVEKEVPAASAPGQRTKGAHLDLWAGKVVRVVKSYSDWVSVRIVQYDAEYGADIWVPKSSLQAFNPAQAKEGRLAPHAIIYDEHGQIKEEEWLNPVFIQAETRIDNLGRVYQIISSGGQGVFIRVKDFVPNPFAGA